jgi:N-acetylglucosamine-6-phosphate deacetylase
MEMRANIAAKLLNPARKGAIKPGKRAGLKILTRHAIEKIRKRMVKGVAMLWLRATSTM